MEGQVRATKAEIVPPGFLQGRVAIVTGGSSGIGRAACLALAGSGARVVVVGRTEAHIAETLDEIGRAAPEAPEALGLRLDVADEADMETMAEQALRRFGRIDILIASAGISNGYSFNRMVPYGVAQLPVGEWDDVIRTNLRGVFLSNRAVLPQMTRQRSGQIINIASSPGGIKGQPFAAAYCASKFAIAGLSEALAEEVGPSGIKVQAIFPDLVDTPLTRGTTLSARLGGPLPAERVASYILFLLALPDDTILLSRRRLGYPVLRRLPASPEEWRR